MMTGLAGTCLILALAFGYASFAMMGRRMESENAPAHDVWPDGPLIFLTMITLTIASVTQERTRGNATLLARIEMPGAALVDKSDDWLPHDLARDEFLA